MPEITEKPLEEKTPEKATAKETVPAKSSQTTSEPSPELKKGIAREYFESAIVTVIMALFGMTFIVQAVKVPTGSMLNTILVGDHLLVNKFIFGKDSLFVDKVMPHRQIKRGDIIVFKYPKDPATNYVKRVIGLPGETIEVKGTRVYINGEELPEHRLLAEQHLTVDQLPDSDAPLDVIESKAPANPSQYLYKVYYSPESDDGEFSLEERRLGGQKFAVGSPFTIPPNEYFVMGDNRENSQDSRYWGTVPRDNVVGRALIVYWSLDRSKDAEGKEPSGNLLYNFLTRTRWSRMGTLVK
jgi:signal peptidase I